MTGLYILIAGVLIAFASFCWTAINLLFGGALAMSRRGGKGVFSLMCGHIAGMIGMAFGGLLAFAGTLMGGWTLFQTYVLPLLKR